MRVISRSNLLVLLMSVAIGAPLAVFLAVNWRGLGQFDVAAERLLRLASSQLAEAITQRMQADFTQAFATLLERLNHDQVRQLDLPRIHAYLASLNSDELCFVDGLFVGNAREGNTGEIYFFPLVPHRGQREPAPEPTQVVVLDADLSASLWRHVNQADAGGRSFGFGEFVHRGIRHSVLVHLLYEDIGRQRHRASARTRSSFAVFHGFIVNDQSLSNHYLPEIVKLVTEQRGLPLDPLPAVPIVSSFNDGGRETYRSGRSLATEYEAEASMPLSFVGSHILDLRDPIAVPARHFRIRTGYEMGSSAAIVRHHGRQQRWGWGAAAIVAVAGLFLTARATYREMRLARTKLEFFSRLSHDAKTPLANIRMFADTLKAGPGSLAPDKMQRYGEILSRQAQRLAHRIDGFLDFARIEAGVHTYPLEPLDLKASLRYALDAYADGLDHGGFHRELAMPDDDVSVVGSHEGLEQLFGNLIDNAVKYSPHDRFLRVSLTTEHGWARVDVSDRGIGIPRGEHRKIFRKFYRVPQVSASSNGSGLGLATVAHVVKVHKGHISVASTPGAGTTFTVRLPLLGESDHP